MSDQKTEQKTLRDEFAMAAMCEVLRHEETHHLCAMLASAKQEIADNCYEMADAMLAARIKEQRHD